MEGPDMPGAVDCRDVDVYFRCCQKIAAAKKAARRPKGMPTARPTVMAGLEQVAWAVEFDAATVAVGDAGDITVVVIVAIAWLAAADDGVKGVPALKVKFVSQAPIVNSPLPEQAKKPFPLEPGHRLILLNEPAFTSLHFCGHCTALNDESVQPPRYMTPALP
jgi:hypothetical protein